MKKKGSIFRQILTPMLLLVFILVAAILSVVWFSMAKSSREQITSGNAEAARLMAEDISGFLSEAYAVSEELAVNPSILTMETDIQTPILESCVERNPYFELLYIQGVDGMQTGRSSGELADRSTRWWFIQTMEEEQPFVSKSYYSVNTNMPCTSVFLPMYRDGEIIGIMASDIKLDSLVGLVEEMSGEGKTSFIIDGEGTVVAHPDHRYVEELYNYKTLTKTVSQKDASGAVLTDLDGNVLTKEEDFEISDGFAKAVESVMGGVDGSGLIENDGQKYFISYSPIPLEGNSDSWSVITLQSYSSAMAATLGLLNSLIAISVAVMAFIIMIMTALARRISKPVVALSGLVSEASEGNFTLSATDSTSRELSLLAGSFNLLVEKVSRILSGIMGVISGVGTSKGDLVDVSEKAEQIVREVQYISEGARKQETDIRRVAELTREAEQQCDMLLNRSKEIVEEAQSISDLCSEGNIHIQHLDEQNRFSLKEVESSYKKILQLNVFSEQVGSIVAQINTISGQTSLLALNASIEAARAGEHGRGFAVVAGQIGKLSENTKEATGVISDIIARLQQEVSETVAVVGSIKESFERQNVAVEAVKGAFSQFDVSSRATLSSIHDVTEMIHEVNRLNGDVAHSVGEIEKISESVSEKTGVVADVVEMQKDEISQVVDKVSEVYRASEILSKDMSKFKMS